MSNLNSDNNNEEIIENDDVIEVNTEEATTSTTDKIETKETDTNTEDKPVDRNSKIRNAAVLSTIVFILILVLANVFIEQAFGNQLEFDWTQNQITSLGDVSKNILEENETPVNITVLSTRENYASNIASSGADLNFVPNLLSEYEANSGGTVSVNFVDPVQNPAIITELDPNGVHNLQQYQIVISNEDHSKLRVLSYQDLFDLQMNQQAGGYYITGYTAEEAISGAIRFVTAEDTPTVYITKGHGETSLTQGFTTFSTLLEQNNFLLEDLDTIAQTQIPEDAEMLLMVNPQSDITTGEVEMYLNYLRQGGSLYVISDFSTATFTNLNEVLLEFNIAITNDRVKENDTELLYAEDNYTFRADISTNPLYPEGAGYNFALATNARAVTSANNARDWVEVTPILQTSDQATREIAGDAENESVAGTQTIAMYSENSGWIDMTNVTEPSKVAVFGSASMFNDLFLQTFQNSTGNFTLFVYSMLEMADMIDNQAADLLIEPKPVVSYYIVAQSENSIQITSFLLTFGVAITLLVIALIIYRRRVNL